MAPEKKLVRLETLRKKHRELDIEIQKEYSMHIDVKALKVQKLQLKEEIEKIERELGMS